MIDIVEAVAELEDAVDLHSARLLFLLDAFAGQDGTGTIHGLTKLAKLDFLLRYPVMLERALKSRRRTVRDVQLEDHERTSVESQMVRYRFGPWDHRYREFVNVLVAKGLATVAIDGRAVVIGLTTTGRELAAELGNVREFETYRRRATALRRHFDLTGTHLMRFIYATFPEIVTLRSNEPIQT